MTRLELEYICGFVVGYLIRIGYDIEFTEETVDHVKTALDHAIQRVDTQEVFISDVMSEIESITDPNKK